MAAMPATPWTADAIPDLTGRTAVVTGANSGLGFHTALELARYGATVVMACRDLRRGETALNEVKKAVSRSSVELRRLDLADLSSVRAFAVEMNTAHPQLDILVNNAGIMAIPRRTTVDDFEMQLGVNHLGHFALTGLLLPCLAAAPEVGRVVTVSSQLHAVGAIDFDDLMSERRYGPWRAYGQSKLANLLFAFELQRRVDRAGLSLTSVACHPGHAATNLMHNAGTRALRLLRRARASVIRVALQPAAHGARPSLYAATMPDVEGGDFFGPHGLGGSRGFPIRTRAAARAYDRVSAARLWLRSVELTGVDYHALA
jgi:NAD(P)-dependent dehydrogenase (short-subunit alcohol dehydrogenase family)